MSKDSQKSLEEMVKDGLRIGWQLGFQLGLSCFPPAWPWLLSRWSAPTQEDYHKQWKGGDNE